MNHPIISIDAIPQIEQQSPNIPSRFDYAILREIRLPLANMNLAIEILEISIWKNDQKICMDVINRNRVRINDLLNELLTCQPADEIQAKILICRTPH